MLDHIEVQTCGTIIKVLDYWAWCNFFIPTSKRKKNIKSTEENQKVALKGIPIRLSADFSAETLQARREWQDIIKVMEGKNLQPRMLYSASISFKFDEEIKKFTEKQKLKEFSTRRPSLQQMPQKFLKAKVKVHSQNKQIMRGKLAEADIK